MEITFKCVRGTPSGFHDVFTRLAAAPLTFAFFMTPASFFFSCFSYFRTRLTFRREFQVFGYVET